MAELGRARPVILASIATILTANIAILSTVRVQAERAIAVAVPSTTQAAAATQDFVVFGKSDTPIASPTVFAVRGDGTQLTPLSQPQGRPAQTSGPRFAMSHNGALLAKVRAGDAGDELWLVHVVGDVPPRLLAHFAPMDASFCGRSDVVAAQLQQPMWSPDDRYIAFLSNAKHLDTFGGSFDINVVDAQGGNVVTAYEAPDATCDRIDASHSLVLPAEFVSLFGWAKSANMAA